MPTSFLGSALRGTFFFIFGLWWSVRYPLKYLRRKANAESQPSYGVQRVEVFEGAVKAFFALAGKSKDEESLPRYLLALQPRSPTRLEPFVVGNGCGWCGRAWGRA